MRNSIYTIGLSKKAWKYLNVSEFFDWKIAISSEDQIDQLCRITVFDELEINQVISWSYKARDIYVQPLLIIGSDDEVDFGGDDEQDAELLGSIMTSRFGAHFPETIDAVRALIQNPDSDYIEYWRDFVQGPGRLYPQNNPLVFGGEFPRVYVQALTNWMSGPSKEATYIREVVDSECGVFDSSDFVAHPTKLGDLSFQFDLRAHPGVGFMFHKGKWSANGLLSKPEILDPQMRLLKGLEDEILKAEQIPVIDNSEIRATRKHLANGSLVEHDADGPVDEIISRGARAIEVEFFKRLRDASISTMTAVSLEKEEVELLDLMSSPDTMEMYSGQISLAKVMSDSPIEDPDFNLIKLVFKIKVVTKNHASQTKIENKHSSVRIFYEKNGDSLSVAPVIIVAVKNESDGISKELKLGESSVFYFDSDATNNIVILARLKY